MPQNNMESVGLGLNKEQAEKAWKMIYRFMDNVKTKMDYDFETNKSLIEDKDIYEIREYIRKGLKGIIRTVLNAESN